MKFLLDTNFLLIPAQFRVDVFSELSKFGKPELYTIDLVLKELGKMRSRKARLAQELLAREKVRVLHTGGRNADSALVKAASKGFVVCTQDRALARRLKSRGTPVVTLRQKKYLVMK